MAQKDLPHIMPVASRRDFLSRAGSGLGAIALAHLLDGSGLPTASAATTAPHPLAPKQPHSPPQKSEVRDLVVHGRRPESP